MFLTCLSVCAFVKCSILPQLTVEFSSFLLFVFPRFGSLKKVKVAHTRLPVTERRVPGLIPVLGSQPVGDVSHKPGGRMSLLFAGLAVTLATLKRAATSFAAW